MHSVNGMQRDKNSPGHTSAVSGSLRRLSIDRSITFACASNILPENAVTDGIVDKLEDQRPERIQTFVSLQQ